MSGRQALRKGKAAAFTLSPISWSEARPGAGHSPDATSFSANVGGAATDRLPVGRERRRAPRRPLEVGVEIYGYDSDLTLIHTLGITANVSRLGVFINTDEEIPVGSKAMVAVRPRHPALLPRLLRGKVVRCHDQDGGFGLAICFDSDISRVAAPHVAALPLA
jgi:hypothetical protein